MVTCIECGYQNVPGTLFCEGCGCGIAADALAGRFATGNMSDRRVGVETVSARFTTGEVDPQQLAPQKAEPQAATPVPVPDESFGGGTHHNATHRQAQPVTPEHTTPTSWPANDVHDGATDSEVAAPLEMAIAYLICESGRRIDVPARDVVIVGREDMRSGIRPDVDLTLDGASAAGVSRRHCRLLRHGDGWQIEDLMSTNFTVVNGKPLPPHTPAGIRNGDDLRLGKLHLKFFTE